MSWFGKIVGGTIGFMFGGPIGAAAGMAMGHYMFDKDAEVKFEQGPLTDTEQLQATFFISTFSLLAKMAKADGVVTQNEIDEISRFIDQDLRLDPAKKRFAIEIFRSAKDSEYRFEDYASQFYTYFSGSPQMLENMLEMLIRVSRADGHVHPNEERLINIASGIFGFQQNRYESIAGRYTPNTDKYYKILGVTKDDADDVIRKKYRQLAQEYHPDKVVSKGLPPEFTEFAKNKFQEIQEAYDQIKKERGIK